MAWAYIYIYLKKSLPCSVLSPRVQSGCLWVPDVSERSVLEECALSWVSSAPQPPQLSSALSWSGFKRAQIRRCAQDRHRFLPVISGSWFVCLFVFAIMDYWYHEHLGNKTLGIKGASECPEYFPDCFSGSASHSEDFPRSLFFMRTQSSALTWWSRLWSTEGKAVWICHEFAGTRLKSPAL